METILFTDIEGSTRLWEDVPDAMKGALAEHDRILADAITGTNGNVLKTTGDGFIAVFASPSDAVGAALQMQEALSAATWGATGQIHVRVGIHAGETEHRNDDYFGPTMNRASRIMAAGHGGQILLSGVVAPLVDHSLPSGTALRDLGFHRLKDLTQPEHLYQLLAPDLPSEFPALRTLDARPSNLPLQLTDFLGRREELAAIEELIGAGNTRLLTIVGPGGTGKTRIALQAAADLLEMFRDGVCFVDLSAERTADAVLEATVRALQLPVSGNGGPLQTLKVRLRDKQLLIVLDNFEQVIDAAHEIADLLLNLPELKLMITSREPLRIRVEHTFNVLPLAVPEPSAPLDVLMAADAVRLFEERGRAVQADFAVTEGNVRTIASICSRLDGLPLAIELAAARLTLFTPAELLARLDERLDILGGRSRDLPDRQRTLWGAIGWSYELLDADERDFLELIAVTSSADLRALEAMALQALALDSPMDVLASLVDKSLVQSREQSGARRFSMLRTVAQFATERLAARPERDQLVRATHAGYYSDLAIRLTSQLQGTTQDAALASLEAELGNLRTAWGYWLDRADLEQLLRLLEGLWALHAAKGWYHAAIDLTAAMISVLQASGRGSEYATDELVIRTNQARALMAVGGYNAEVESALSRALELAEAGGNSAREFSVLRALASIYTQRTSWEAALTIGRHLIAVAEREQDNTMLAEGHYVLGANTLFSDPLGSLAELEEAIRLFGARPVVADRLRLGPNTAVLARVASSLLLWMTGALDRSVARMEESLALSRSIDHPYTIAYALYHSGFLAIGRGHFDECQQYAEELAQVSETHGYPIWATLARMLEGVAAAATGRADEGLTMAEAAVELYQGLTPPPAFWPFVLMLRANVYVMAGQPERALTLVDEATAAVSSLNLDAPALRALRADVMRQLPDSDPDAIEAQYRAAIELGTTSGLHLGALVGATGLVTLRRQLGRTPDGSEELATVYALFEEGHSEHDLVAARALLESTHGRQA